MTTTETRKRLPLTDRLISFVLANSPLPGNRSGAEYAAANWRLWAIKHQSGGGSPKERSDAAHEAYVEARGVCYGLEDCRQQHDQDERLARGYLRQSIARLAWLSVNTSHDDAYWRGAIERETAECFRFLRDCRRLKAWNR